ncbi:hypothetical protein EAO71_36180 [Streptomyces sp. ms191]|uniref:hypothetical protein n=1 Tax=unclassified Streptomyces TaxID=2593676 RepID=UPI0011CDA64B|nr:hypothetical protein [Streptomyces sp. ms191]TXS12700.1 hypothetical protein EAO71_36180 [Streptomyces sp. ms191]
MANRNSRCTCGQEQPGRLAPDEQAHLPADMDVQVHYRSAAGRTVVHEPSLLRDIPLEERAPLSEPHAYRGRRSILTNWFCATNGVTVWCSSTVQMDAAMLLDFDPDIVCFQSGVAELHWRYEGRQGTVRPAFFARTRDGRRLVIPHRSAARAAWLEERVLRHTAAAAGWQIRPLQVPGGVLHSSLRSMAHFRGAEFAPEAETRQVLLDIFAVPRPMQEGAAVSGLGLQAAGHVWHLLWTGALVFDRTLPLLPTSRIWAGTSIDDSSEGNG